MYEERIGNYVAVASKLVEKDKRIAELEAALGALWDTAVTVNYDGLRGCFVREADWRSAMSKHPALSPTQP